MDTKIIAIAVIAVVAIGGCAAFFIMNNNDGPKESQYDILDSTDNIKNGLTMKLSGNIGTMDVDTTHTVISVADGKVTYTEKFTLNGIPMGNLDLKMFAPESFYGMYGFDYTDSTLPEGINVVHNDNDYTITGMYNYDDSLNEFSLTITYDGAEVTQVSGSVNSTQATESVIITNKIHYSTNSGKVTVTSDSISTTTEDCDLKDFYTDGNMGYDADEYEGCKITEKTGTYEGKSVTIYTVTGKTEHGTYNGVNIYVYKGTILREEGDVTYKGLDLKATILLKITA